MALSRSQFNEKQHTDVKEPQRYKVYIHNDDFTTTDFVVMVLKCVFFLSEERATGLMLQVHKSGKGMAGVYTYDVAVSKVRKATAMARQEGFPLRFSIVQE